MPHQFARILSSSQLRALESDWIKAAHPNWGMVLMEVAGLAAAQTASTIYSGAGIPGADGITVICGRGNNGGDGLVVARHLARWNLPVQVFMVESAAGQKSSSPESEASINKAVLVAAGVELQFTSSSDLEPVRSAIQASSLVVDALLGTGLDRPVEGVYADLIQLINQCSGTVLAIDIPSGINSDSGQVMGTAVQADVTVTFGHLKAGLLHFPGAEHAGEISLVDIGLPPLDLFEKSSQSADWWLATYQQVADWLVLRTQDAHKGTFGRLLSVAGSGAMTGAAMLSCRSALRSGVGLSVLATPHSVLTRLPAEEVIYRGLPETEFGTISCAALGELETEMEQSSAVLIGPGLSSNVETIKFVHEFMRTVSLPTIVDADALNAISQNKNSANEFKNAKELVFTPHPKELSRLLGISVSEIQSDRIASAESARDKFGCNVILKGAHTVVATVQDGTYIIPCGNSGMATAGAGDVLSGIIGSFLAQGMKAGQAAVAGAYIHAAAGDLAAYTNGEDGLIASDILEALPVVLADMRAGEFTGTEIEQMVLSL